MPKSDPVVQIPRCRHGGLTHRIRPRCTQKRIPVPWGRPATKFHDGCYPGSLHPLGNREVLKTLSAEVLEKVTLINSDKFGHIDLFSQMAPQIPYPQTTNKAGRDARLGSLGWGQGIRVAIFESVESMSICSRNHRVFTKSLSNALFSQNVHTQHVKRMRIC